MTHNFGEKPAEYYAKSGGNIPVVQSAKFIQAKKKAVEIIDSGKYGIDDGDFWILMNATKKGDKMMYSGLILSHNGCLKINDRQELNLKFKPSCVREDKDGYKGSLVYTYCCDEQGIYEVGEASSANCKNEYPYAMAYKRLFDRVVLKLSRLAFDGIYSDSESDEFAESDEYKLGTGTGGKDKPDKPDGNTISETAEEPFDSAVRYADEAQIEYLSRAYGTRLGEFLNAVNVADLKLLSYETAQNAVNKLKEYYAKKRSAEA